MNARALAEVGRHIGLGGCVELGHGEESTGGRSKASILSDTVEAVIDAVHLGGRLRCVGPTGARLFDPLLDAASELGAGLDWKTLPAGAVRDVGLGVPETIIQDKAPDHVERARQVTVGDDLYGTASAAQEGSRAGDRRDRLRRALQLAGLRVSTPWTAIGASADD